MAVCKCDTGIINSGIPSCVSGFGRIVKLFFVYQVATDGTSNAIPCSQTIDQAYLTDKLNETDPSKRWFPTDSISNVTEVRNDPTTESIDNIDLIVAAGSRTFNGFFVSKGATSPTYLKFLKSLECPAIQYFGIDENGTIVGIETTTGNPVEAALTGINVQGQSITSRPVPATSTTLAKNELTFTVDSLVQDQDISFIGADEITADLLNATGLLDVTLVESATPATDSSLVVEASLVYGSVCKKIKYKGATDAADWLVENTTTSSTLTVTSAVENPEGTYTLNFAAQTSADVLTVQVVKDGFSSNVATITIP